MAKSLDIKQEKIVIDWQEPENIWQNAPNSIHNDEVAQKIGMRGGTIPGTVHLGHFRPIIEQLWGDSWWQCGSISMYYTYATTHREKVRAIALLPSNDSNVLDNCQIEAYAENFDGRVVCKGTLSIGQSDQKGYVSALQLPNVPSDLRILKHLKTGTRVESEKTIEQDSEDEILRDIPDHYQILNAGFPKGSVSQPSVGFFGATEIRLLHGPVRKNEIYSNVGEVVSVGESKKTEFAWVDSRLTDKEGEVIAEMRHLTRWMKASSPLW